MNMSALISRLKIELGLYTIALPLKDVDESIKEIIINTTLRTYSQYFPQKMKIVKTSRELVERFTSLEYVEMPLEVPYGTEICEVCDVSYDTRDFAGLSHFASAAPLFATTSIYDVIMANASANVSNIMVPKITWDFVYPRTLKMYNLYTGGIIIDILKLHDPSLQSIPFSQEESFYKLAKLDTKNALYAVIKHYNELETAHGRINLKIDDWASSEDDRKEILREWDDTFHLDRKTVYFSN